MITDPHISQAYENLWYCIYGTEKEFYEHYPCRKQKRGSAKRLWEYVTGKRNTLNSYNDPQKRLAYQREWQRKRNGIVRNNKETVLHNQEGRTDSSKRC